MPTFIVLRFSWLNLMLAAGEYSYSSADNDDYIGEYTGELISDEEADVRGKLYKKANTSSYLFNLNDQASAFDI
ncbi:hypothetical protein CTI12_AA506810 [Artemisia annua]|uniref:Uncharacterized protein n=1 Tax=Artemisia annua TaxID=35608 RepID=A0A2U1LC78_ARTAN|nr:hypothetical protein CTI12_AA506810 [Artemisia annua]